MTSPNTSPQQWLLYSYPWMPYPRRVQLYLREKRIPESAIAVVHVSDPQKGDCVVPYQADKYPPRPKGSLPILAIPPSSSTTTEWTYIYQSMAIIDYIEHETTSSNGSLSHINARPLVTGKTSLARARLLELSTLAEELTVIWNPVRIFGSGAGTMNRPDCAREMFRWVSRVLVVVDRYLADQDFESLRNDEESVSLADIVLFGHFDFIEYCYGIDLTVGTGEDVKDVYGRIAKEVYPNLKGFYEAFKVRKSVRRVLDGEVASQDVLKMMQTWHHGVW